TYILELDMVQEAVAWFKNKGSQTASARVKNGNTPLAGVAKTLNRIFTASNKSNGSTESDDFVPHMQMYGVPKQEVVEWVELNGGKIVDIQPDQSAGQDWISYRYCITK